MFRGFSQRFGWLYSIGAKFMVVAPAHTALIVFLTIGSQLSLLLALFIPLKIIILLGTPGVPSYFPSIFYGIDREKLLLILSVSAATIYGFHLLAEYLISKFTKFVSLKLLERSKKIVLFEDQENIAAKGYQRYVLCIANIVFFVLVVSLLIFIYPQLALIAVVHTFLMLILLEVIYIKSKDLNRVVLSNIGTVSATWAALGFFSAFGFIVYQSLAGVDIKILVAMISLLSLRQAFSRISACAGDIAYLVAQRLRLSALLFHSQQLLSKQGDHEDGFWFMCASTHREEWVKNLLKRFLDIDASKVEVTWYQACVMDTAIFSVKALFNENDDSRASAFLVKLYNNNRNSLAIHEATLLAEVSSYDFPSLPLISVGQCQGFHFHIFSLSSIRRVKPSEIISVSHDVINALSYVELPNELVAKYRRSKPLLWQRLDLTLLTQLRIAAASDTAGMLEVLITKLDVVQTMLQTLPVVLVNPMLFMDGLAVKEDGSAIAIHWEYWTLEPIGAAWPIHLQPLEKLYSMMLENISKRPELSYISFQKIKLVSVLYAFERHCSRQQYDAALLLVSDILDCLKELEI